jgi:hypothetical protein
MATLWVGMLGRGPNMEIDRLQPTLRKSCQRYNQPGHAHALTFSCFQRQPFLSSDTTRAWFVEAIELARQKHEFHLWSYVSGGYDRNLWSPVYVWDTIDYIHANPVRRKLCNSPLDWAWSSAQAYAGKAEVPISIDFHSIPDDPRSVSSV